MDAFKVVGKNSLRRFDAYSKASGQAKFCMDVVPKDAIVGKILRSPYAHARIRRLDTRRAEALPGVEAVITYRDEETKNLGLMGTVDQNWVGVVRDLVPVFNDRAGWEGEDVGVALAAVSDEIAEEALRLIDVEWEILPLVLDAEESMKPGAVLLHPEYEPEPETGLDPGRNRMFFRELTKGDIEKGFAEAEHTMEIGFKQPQIAHAGVERWGVIARWEGQRLTLRANTQRPDETCEMLSRWLRMDSSSINVDQRGMYVGGSYGNKNIGGRRFQAIAALLAGKAGKPVKILYSRKDDFSSGDCSSVSNIKVGYRSDGTITALDIDTLFNAGQDPGGMGLWYGDMLGSNFLRQDTRASVRHRATFAYTNRRPVWWIRDQQNGCAYNKGQVMDRVADALVMDPTEIYLKNINPKEAELSLRECTRTGKEAIGWEQKWHRPGGKTLPNGRKHGIGHYASHEWNSAAGSQVGLKIANDGSVLILGARPNVGCTEQTTYAMIVAEELGARAVDVHMSLHGTDVGIQMCSPGGSIGLSANSKCLKEAAAIMKGKILDCAALKLGVSALELDIKDSRIYVKADPARSLTFLEVFDVPFWEKPWVIAQTKTANNTYHCQQAHFAEVEVNTETGEIEVTNVALTNDVGKCIRPATVQAQQYGAFIQAIGRFLMEEEIIDRSTGVRLNPNFLDYKVPTTLEVPRLAGIQTFIKEIGKEGGAWGICGIGEDNSVTGTPLLLNALYNAIGVRIAPPVTPDKVLKALGRI
jgi:CO/xanthine dehydrogenase Mo-binding subunit